MEYSASLLFFSGLLLSPLTIEAQPRFEKATFGGGCFWCMEKPFDQIDGVVSVISGYTGGHKENPTYEDVSSGETGHIEAVEVTFDPGKIGYSEILDLFWRQVDPTDPGGQFADRGERYKTAIFYHSDKQMKAATVSKEKMDKSGIFDKPVVTKILPGTIFYPAEEYHQNYYKKNQVPYQFYRTGSGRDRFLKKVWRDIDDQPKKKEVGLNFEKPALADLKKLLTPLQYHVTQEDGTERPFDNPYWNNKKAGIYVDIVSGAVLFSSTDQFDSKTGWPSFTKPLVSSHIVERKDKRLFTTRTEVRSRYGDAHLGHVFPDGPQPTGLRYCINSAALRFIPKDALEKEGYEKYSALFE